MSKLITVQNEVVEVSDELYEFMESDRKRQAAKERSDRRHLMPILINSIDNVYWILANEVGVEDGIGRQLAKPIVACDSRRSLKHL